ncbi:MAG: 3-oxoacid CoA-transferase subunit B [Synergistaceae bacterium]|jgi:3-oxoacid CoA-transferase B subunit|nr:3-oxoacid CoA-transferase subunit B [Synergistaceae bacterium]
MEAREIIARRAAWFLEDGDLVNLGIGIPTMVANYVPEGVEVILQCENGLVGQGPAPAPGKEDRNVVDAGGKCTTILPLGACVDSATSFALIRGGHLDASVLGALEVDQEGNLANWIVPGKIVPGMGGAMDLASGARKVIVTMEHCTRNGEAKILKKCTLPLTAVKRVTCVVTELCVLTNTPEGLMLSELAPGVTVEEVLAKTEAELIVPEKIVPMAGIS